MPIQTIETRRLYRQIADQLRTLIVAGEFPVGSRLPAERELCVQLGVSRPSVREALIALEVEGLVEVRIGSGIYVRSRQEPAPRIAEATHGPLEIIRARQLIEGELAADIVAQRAPIRGDRMFHLCIAHASDNSALVDVVTGLFDERNGPLAERLVSHFEHAQSWRVALDEHRSVVTAIAAHDAAGARKAMRAHLQRSHDRFSVAWTAVGPVAAEVASAP
jgi:GntR family transcriptional regulator, transcriptional repressor for pyruvate dehydrogenase complex